MENFRNFIKKQRDYITDPYNFTFITSLDKRARIITFLSSIYYKIFKKTLLTIDNGSSELQNYIVLLNMLLILLKNYSVEYDFVHFDKDFFVNIQPHNNYTLYKAKLHTLLDKEKKIIQNNILTNREIDLVISSGGNVGFYSMGITNIMHIINANVKRISGVSMGSLIGLFYLLYKNNEISLDIYHKFFEHYKNNPDDRHGSTYYLYHYWCIYVRNTLDKDFYKKCNNKLFIGYSEINKDGLFFRVKSSYTSNDDVMLTCIGSCSIPYISIDGLCLLNNNKKILDGALIQSNYLFEDQKYDQFIIDLYKVEYAYEKVLLPIDDNIVDLMYKGAEEMVNYLNNQESEIIHLIEKEKK